MRLQIFWILSTAFIFSSCLQTRSSLGANQQSQVYHKKNIENQTTESESAAEITPQKVDDRDEMIRTLNGRVESLENKIQLIEKEKQMAQAVVNPDVQKIALLQEALIKMESQIQKLENSEKLAPSQIPQVVTTTSHTSGKSNLKNKSTAFDVAEDYFQKKEWKKSILSYQSYVEEHPKNKIVPEAKYKIGFCFQELGLKDEALAFYEEILAQYPKSDYAKKSKAKITFLNSKKAAK